MCVNLSSCVLCARRQTTRATRDIRKTNIPCALRLTVKVDFCAGHEHDVTMDDELDEGDFDGSDDMGFGDEMDF